jgi:hypothetical protein
MMNVDVFICNALCANVIGLVLDSHRQIYPKKGTIYHPSLMEIGPIYLTIKYALY